MQFLGSLLGSLRQKRSREEDVLLAHPSPHMALSPGSSSDQLESHARLVWPLSMFRMDRRAVS